MPYGKDAGTHFANVTFFFFFLVLLEACVIISVAAAFLPLRGSQCFFHKITLFMQVR